MLKEWTPIMDSWIGYKKFYNNNILKESWMNYIYLVQCTYDCVTGSPINLVKDYTNSGGSPKNNLKVYTYFVSSPKDTVKYYTPVFC